MRSPYFAHTRTRGLPKLHTSSWRKKKTRDANNHLVFAEVKLIIEETQVTWNSSLTMYSNSNSDSDSDLHYPLGDTGGVIRMFPHL